MHIPLVIAIVSLLAWTLLPQLDRYSDAESSNNGMRSYLARLAHWVNG